MNRKDLYKWLGKVAESIPENSYQYLAYFNKLKWFNPETKDLKDNLPLDKEEASKYVMKSAEVEFRPMNHKRRLKIAYKDEGLLGVEKYLKPYGLQLTT